MAKTSELFGLALLAGVALYAVNKFGNNAEIRQGANVAQTEVRSEASVAKKELKTDASVEKTEIRNDTIRDVADKVTSIFTNNSSSGGHSTTSLRPPEVKIISTTTPTTQSNPSPFLSDSTGSANMSLVSGGTATANNTFTTIKPASYLKS